MEYTKLIGLAAASALICMTVRKLSQDGANYIALGFFIFVAGFAISSAAPYIEFIRELAEKGGITDCASVILRALSVGVLTAFAADMCRSAGENDIARSAETIGKCALMLLALPLIKSIVSTAEGMLS